MSFPPEVSAEAGEVAPERLSYEQLQAQLAASQEAQQRAEGERDLERGRLDSFIQRGDQPSQPPQSAALPPLGPEPDQSLQPDEHRVWAMERDRRRQVELDQRFDRQATELRQEMSDTEQRNQLWTSFQAKYPKYAVLGDLVRSAYQSLHARGALPTTADAVLDAVKNEMDRMSGTNLETVSPPADRTAGTSAGERPATPKPRTPSNEEGGGTMHDAISSWQQKHGLI